MAFSTAFRCSQTLPFSFPNPFFSQSTGIPRIRNPSLLPSFCTVSSTLTLTADPDSSLPYGPSLRKGWRPPPSTTPSSDEENEVSIDKESFSRSFDLAALRVPAEHCASLENRLRGHLLNWPRVRNVARVPGDEIDPGVKKLLRDSGAEEGCDARLNSLSRRVNERADSEGETLSSVLYREKLVKDFNHRGFLKFRNLAKISRPKKKKRKGDEREEIEATERRGKCGFCAVEVVGDEENENLSGLLGDGFRRGRWRGSTRLLLLDDQYAKKGAEELPEAVKVVLQGGDITLSRPLVAELVHCRLTIFYNYWAMNEILEALLPEGMVVPTAFETIGHIAHLNLRDEHLPYKKLISEVVLDKNKPKIQTVVNKIDAIQNNYRTMQLEVLAGNHSLVTTVVENGLRFHVDLATVYWNSRLATERQRLISSFTSNDVVCDVFSGVGPIAISAAKKVKYAYANDLNPNAVEYLERNVVLNKVDRKIEIFNMDGRRFISSMLASQQQLSITQVVMNLPNNAADFLDAFRGVFKRRPKEMCSVLPKVHVYGFSKAQVPEFDFHERVKMGLCESAVDVEMHRVRLVAPGKWMLCGSFVLPETVALGK